MPQLWVIATLVVGAAGAAGESPSPRGRAQQLFNQATSAYGDGRYEAALADFARSYELLPLPELLFDIAQCQRNLGRWAEAAKGYARFLEAAPESPHHAEAETYQAEAERQLAVKPETPAPPPPSAPAAAEAPVVPAPGPAAPAAAVSAPAEVQRSPAGIAWLAGGGIAALVTGGICVALAAVELGSGSALPNGGTNYPMTYSQAQTYSTVGNVGEVAIGAGAALLVGAGLWGWLGPRPAASTAATP